MLRRSPTPPAATCPRLRLLLPGLLTVSVCLVGLSCAAGGIAVRQEPDAQAVVTESMVAMLRSRLHPIAGENDLDPLLTRVGDARLVLLGESTHGTAEFYTWRSAITRRLIAEHGFAFVAVEGDWGAALAVDRAIRDADGEGVSGVAEALGAFSRWPGWVWNNRETAEFLEWLAGHNRGREPASRVAFNGLDLYGVAESLQEVLEFLEEHDPERAAAARRAARCLLRFRADPFRYAQVLDRGGRSCAADVVRVTDLLEEVAGPLKEHDAQSILHLRQSARVVGSAERHIRMSRESGSAGWNERVRHMADTVEALLAYHQQRLAGDAAARGVVWAHNTHVGDARATAMHGLGQESLGSLMRGRLGAGQVVLVGFGTHGGRVVAADRWLGPRRVLAVPRGLPGSVEDLFHRTGVAAGLAVFGPEFRDARWLDPLPHRAIGVVYDPARERQRHYVPTVLPLRYDAFVWIDHTSPLTSR